MFCCWPLLTLFALLSQEGLEFSICGFAVSGLEFGVQGLGFWALLCRLMIGLTGSITRRAGLGQYEYTCSVPVALQEVYAVY